MADELSKRYRDLLQGSYDCVDRIVLNAYNTLCYSAGGFRQWWRRLMDGSDAHLDNAHLMRMAGRFSRRVRGFAKARNIPVIDCRRGERKHDVAEEYLATHTVKRGLFLVLVARAIAPVWDVRRSRGSLFLTKKTAFVNHYSFHCAARRLVVSPAQPGGTRRRFLGPMANPDPKGERDNRMPEKRRSGPGAGTEASAGPA